MLLLRAFKSQFDELKLAKAYEILVNTVPMLTSESILVLETVFFDTSEEESNEDDEGEGKETGFRQTLIIKL